MKVELVSPKRASEYLQHNTDNRKLRGWWVNSIAGAITRGEWVLTHQGVAFDTTGKLIDGQHKLYAVIAANKPVMLAVYRGISSDAFKVLDIGVKRSYAEITGLSKKTAEVCRGITSILSTNSIQSAEQILTVANSGIADLHDAMMTQASTTSAVSASTPVRMMAVVMVLDGASQKYIFDLYSNLVNLRYDSLPPIAHSFLRQVANKSITPHNKSDLLARAQKLFNPHFADNPKLLVSSTGSEDALNYIRKAMNNTGISL
jgi:hypothetical protein